RLAGHQTADDVAGLLHEQRTLEGPRYDVLQRRVPEPQPVGARFEVDRRAERERVDAIMIREIDAKRQGVARRQIDGLRDRGDGPAVALRRHETQLPDL